MPDAIPLGFRKQSCTTNLLKVCVFNCKIQLQVKSNIEGVICSNMHWKRGQVELTYFL